MQHDTNTTTALTVLARRPAPEWATLAHHPQWGPLACLLSLAAHLEQASAPGQDLDRSEMAAALRLLPTLDHATDRAGYILTAHARACGWTWPDITRAQGLSEPKAVARRHDRQSERHPDYNPPLAHTLAAHTTHASSLLTTLDEDLGLHTHRAVADRLGALLLAATLTGASGALVATWLTDDTLTGPQQALRTRFERDAVSAVDVLREHARGRPGIRAEFVSLMRDALQGSLWSLEAGTDQASPPGELVRSEPPAEDLYRLQALIHDTVAADEVGTTAQTLREFAQRIGAPSGRKAFFTALDRVAALDSDLRHRLWGDAGEELWARVHRWCLAQRRRDIRERASETGVIRPRSDDGLLAVSTDPLVVDTDPDPDQAEADSATPDATLEELRELARGWIQALPGPIDVGDHRVAARRLGAVLLAALTEHNSLEEARTHVVPHWLERDDTLAYAIRALDARPTSHPAVGEAREVLKMHARNEPSVRARLVSLMRAAVAGPETAAAVLPPSPKDTSTNETVHSEAGDEVARAVAAAGWPDDWAAPVAELVDAVRLLVFNLPSDQARPLRALVEAVDTADGLGLVRAVETLRGLDTAVRAELLGDDGQRALEALPTTVPVEDETPSSLSDSALSAAREERWPAQAARLLPDRPVTAAALAKLVAAVGGSSGVQNLSGLASDQRPYRTMYTVVRAVEQVDLDAAPPQARGDLLDDLLALKPTRAPFGRRHPEGAAALAELQRAARGEDQLPEPSRSTPARRIGYGRLLERAGLSREAADALATPLTEFVVKAGLASHRQPPGRERRMIEALETTLMAQRGARVQTLLRMLPRLDLYGLNEWVALSIAIDEHAPHLARPLDPALLVSGDLPTEVAEPLAVVVHWARPSLLASWAPHAPAWEAGPALERLVAAIDTGDTVALPEALDEVTRLRRDQLNEDGSALQSDQDQAWMRLVYAWRTHRAHTGAGVVAPASEGWTEWHDRARVVFSPPALAEAVAQLLDAANRPLYTDALDEDEEAHRALEELQRAVIYRRKKKLGRILDDVLRLKPDRAPIKDHPRLSEALANLINTYDHQ